MNNQDTDSLDFMRSYLNPAWEMQRKPLPVIINAPSLRVTATVFEAVKNGGAIPVFHKVKRTPDPDIKTQSTAIDVEAEAVAFHMQQRRNRQN